MTSESAFWKLSEYVRGRLEAIAPAQGYFNTAGSVVPGPIAIEEIDGELESPGFAYEIADIATIADERTFDEDKAITTVTVHGYKKTSQVGAEWKLEANLEASRLHHDLWKALMESQGMGCNAHKVEAASPNRWGLVPGMPGWVEAVTTVLVYHALSYRGE